MDRDRSKDIAVIGIAARFPGPDDLGKWWAAIKEGQILTTRYDNNVLLESGISQAVINDPNYISVRGHLPNADRFDNKLFRISPRDAELMDPQHRLMLEMAWSALEDAGYGQSKDRSITGVFASGSGSSYLRTILTQGPLDPDTLEQAIHGSEPDFIASLIAYKLNLTGPAVGIQTACSSSLVAIHFAVKSLLNGDCDQALVVAAGIHFPQAGYLHVPGGIKSASGICRPFDQNADGVLEGSGAACLVLRRFADTLEEQHMLYGTILGTAINNDGAAKAGYFAPSVFGQATVIENAVRAAEIDISSIGYLEMHGTGTHVGDPIEWTAATEAYQVLGAQPQQIAIGSVKANMGHLDAAAGLAALIKTLFVVKEGVIPPLAGFKTINPLLEAIDTPLFVPEKQISWETDKPRRAAISAFGIGGTNAHVIIEQPPRNATISTPSDTCPQLIVLSALDSEALLRAAACLKNHLLKKQESLTDIAFTLANGRAILPERLVVCGHTHDEIIEALDKNIDVIRGHVLVDKPKPIIFLFPGQGTQYPGMACSFSRVIPGFSQELEHCLQAFEPIIANKIQRALTDVEFSEQELNETSLAQPALFALEYAVSKSLMKMGMLPSAVVGHSLGEITAACIAGTLSLSDAANFVMIRGQAMQNCPEGGMLAVNCSVEKAQLFLRELELPLYIAAINTPEHCVISGDYKHIDNFQEYLLNHKIPTRRLKASRAFHSPLVKPAVQDMAIFLEQVSFQPLRVPIVLNTTGQFVSSKTTLTAELFLEQAQSAVHFAESLSSISQHFSEFVMVEVGPSQTLSSAATLMGLNSLALSANNPEFSDGVALKTMGTLWTLGYLSSLSAICHTGKRAHLPTYPFFGPQWIAAEAKAGLSLENGLTKSVTHSITVSADITLTQEPPEKDISALLTKLWKELLHCDELEQSSDFFDLGGDSLLMIRLVRQVNQMCEVQIRPHTLISARTLGEQIIALRQFLV